MLDIYSELMLPLWAVLLIQSTGLPWLQALITDLKVGGTTSKKVTVALNVVFAVFAIIGSSNGFSIPDLLLLAAPGVFITSNSYDKFWQVFKIREWLMPEEGLIRGA